MAQASRTRVALLYGGRSGEHEISIRSAESVKQALDRSRYEIVEYFIDRDGKWHPKPLLPQPGANPGIDVVFPMLHGTFGEDGTVQGLLEMAALPYVGAGVLASGLAMDKAVTKKICKAAGLPVVESVVLRRGCFEAAGFAPPFPFPVFVKPANLGSSVGIAKAKNQAELEAALTAAARYDAKIIVERGVAGREFECGVLGGNPPQASMPCEIIPSQEFYTYEDKYLLDTARTELPPKLAQAQIDEIRGLAAAAFEAVCCEGMARVDFLMDRTTGEFFVNEVNTIPGFTSISMFPKMWEYSGLPYPRLLDRLIELAFERQQSRRHTQYSK
ncbi:MAG: D-alanine--D-alanine ligase family protein [Bryobacteraceae bacterium]